MAADKTCRGLPQVDPLDLRDDIFAVVGVAECIGDAKGIQTCREGLKGIDALSAGKSVVARKGNEGAVVLEGALFGLVVARKIVVDPRRLRYQAAAEACVVTFGTQCFGKHLTEGLGRCE